MSPRHGLRRNRKEEPRGLGGGSFGEKGGKKRVVRPRPKRRPLSQRKGEERNVWLIERMFRRERRLQGSEVPGGPGRQFQV